MAWSFTAHRGAANNKVSGTVLTVLPNATIPVGAVVVAVAVSDNISTGGGQTSNHVVADFKGNTWTKIREQSNAAAAGAGITLSVWIAQITTQLVTTDPIVLGLSAAATSKAIGLYQYAIGAGNLFRVSGVNGSEQDATTAPTVTLNTLESLAYAMFGVVAREDDTAGTYTMDADYNDRTKFGTTGGVANTNASCIVGDRLATLTGDTFAPNGLSAAADVATILVALAEVVPITITCTKVMQSGGKVYISWSDKDQMEFASLADAQAFVGTLTKEDAKKLGLRRYLFVDPTASNPSLIEGKSIRFTDALPQMVTVG